MAAQAVADGLWPGWAQPLPPRSGLLFVRGGHIPRGRCQTPQPRHPDAGWGGSLCPRSARAAPSRRGGAARPSGTRDPAPLQPGAPRAAMTPVQGCSRAQQCGKCCAVSSRWSPPGSPAGRRGQRLGGHSTALPPSPPLPQGFPPPRAAPVPPACAQAGLLPAHRRAEPVCREGSQQEASATPRSCWEGCASHLAPVTTCLLL